MATPTTRGFITHRDTGDETPEAVTCPKCRKHPIRRIAFDRWMCECGFSFTRSYFFGPRGYSQQSRDLSTVGIWPADAHNTLLNMKVNA